MSQTWGSQTGGSGGVTDLGKIHTFSRFFWGEFPLQRKSVIGWLVVFFLVLNMGGRVCAVEQTTLYINWHRFLDMFAKKTFSIGGMEGERLDCVANDDDCWQRGGGCNFSMNGHYDCVNPGFDRKWKWSNSDEKVKWLSLKVQEYNFFRTNLVLFF